MKPEVIRTLIEIIIAILRTIIQRTKSALHISSK